MFWYDFYGFIKVIPKRSHCQDASAVAYDLPVLVLVPAWKTIESSTFSIPEITFPFS
jgi:hypothetical protein